MHAHKRTLVASLGFADPDKKNSKHDLGCHYMGLPEQTAKLLRLLRPELSQDRQLTQSAWHGFLIRACDASIRVSLASDLSIKSVDAYDSRVHSSVGQRTEPDWRSELTRFKDDVARVAGGEYVDIKRHARLLTVSAPEPEAVVSVGTGTYKRVVGFLDVRFRYTWRDALVCHVAEQARKAVAMSEQLLDALRDKTIPRITQLPDPVISFFTSDGDVDSDSVVIEVKATPVPAGDVIRQMRLYMEHDTRHVRHWVVATTYPVTRTDVSTFRSAGLVHVQLGRPFERWLAAHDAEAGTPSGSLEM